MDTKLEDGLSMFAASIKHGDIKLRLLSYAGVMDLFAYANGTEFINLKLNDAAIPDNPIQTARVAGWAYEQSEVHHQADAFIGNMLVHGGGAALDRAINDDIRNWWSGTKALFLNRRYDNFSAHPNNLKSGKNKFDVSISNHSPLATCTFVIEHVPAGGAASNLVVMQLTPSRTGWGQELTFS
jgi:hypothetical protein